MKPPICAACGERFGPETGGLVTFARSPSDDAWYERAAKPGFVGHPPNVEWFCGAHVERARALADRTAGEALKLLHE